MRSNYALPVAVVALALAGCAGSSAPASSPLAPSADETLKVADPRPAAPTPEAAPVAVLPAATLDDIATSYVKLVLAYGEIEAGYVDAYYGPDGWKAEAVAAQMPLARVDVEAQNLLGALGRVPAERTALVQARVDYLRNQLGALAARARMRSGLRFSFDDEVRALYDVEPPHYSEADFRPALARLEALLPNDGGTLAERYNRYVDRYAIPKDRIETVMQAAIAAARARTAAHIALPPDERFELALVGDKPWSAYNWYQGGGVSRIEVNTDLPIAPARVIELASHEGYPGHHVYNGLLEARLVKPFGWPEFQVYPLFSPQSFIAEGSADFGVGLAFPPAEKLRLTQQLFALAGFDPRQAATYLKVVTEARALAPAAIEAARNYLEGRADAAQTVAYLQTWTLASPERAAQRVRFFDRYGAYIINYSYGEELVRGYIERRGDKTPGSWRQWHFFEALLSTPRVPTDLTDPEVPIALPPSGPAAPKTVPVEVVPPAAPRPGAPLPASPPLVAAPTTAAAAPVPIDAPVRGKVTDLVGFEGFMLKQPTPAEFRAHYPDVQLVLPGQITTKEFRLDHSRYFAQLDAQGRIVSGKFM